MSVSTRIDLHRTTVLITGATSGIGLHLAQIMAHQGHQLVLVSRSSTKLKQVASQIGPAAICTITADLTQPSAAREIKAQLLRSRITIDILVNNAGFATYGCFHQLPLQRELDQIQLNITSLVHLTRLLLPDMVKAGWGRILNLSSTAAFVPGPLMATYYSSKAFVLHFSESLHAELAHTGVTVTAVCPGITATNFFQAAGMPQSKLVHQQPMSPTVVAQTAYRAMIQGRAVVIPGRRNQFYILMSRLLPRGLVRFLVHLVQKAKS